MKKINLLKVFKGKFLSLFCLMTVILIQSVYSQAQKTVVLNGLISESATKKPLQFASVSLLTLKDSTLVKGDVSNTLGAFVFNNVVPGTYRLKLSFLGYTTIRKIITVKGTAGKQNLGDFPLEEGKSLMDEVVITATIPVLVKKDTLEYNADMFKVEKNAVIEDMLKKLPGVEIDGSGNIKAQGVAVSRVFVDGKQFFGSDPLIATQMLPAAMISKVQIIDKKSDQAEFSGVDDGSIEKIINIVTRSGYKQGTFGKVSGGYGNLDRYDAGLSINKFSGDKQMSLIGTANNTNNMKFTLDMGNTMNNRRGSTLSTARGGRSGGGGGGGGFSSMTSAGRGMGAGGQSVTETAGLNFRDKIGKKIEFTGSYFYNGSNKNSSSSSLTQTLRGDSSIYKSDTSSNFNNTVNHRINMEFTYQIDSMNSIIFRPNISYALTTSERSSNSVTLGQTGFRLNDSKSSSINDGSNWNSTATLLYRRRFNKRGRSFTLNLGGDLTSGITDSYSKSEISRYIVTPGTLPYVKTNLLLNNTSQRDGFNARASYTEPLSLTRSLEMNYYYSKSFNSSKRAAFGLNEADSTYTIPDTTYSNRYDNAFVNQRLGISYQTRAEKLTYTFGVGIESSEIQNTQEVRGTLYDRSQKTFNFSPTASLNYAFTNRNRLTLQYRGTTNEPSIDQLQPIASDPNSLTIRKGNPDLKSSFTNDLSLGYNLTDIKTFANYFVNFQFSNVLNSISNNYIYGASGEQIIIPVNVKGAYDASLNLGMGRPIANNKFSINTSGSLSWSNDVNYIRNTSSSLNTNTVLDTAGSLLNTTRTLTAGYNLAASINGKVVMFTASGRVNYNRAWQSAQITNTNIFVSYNLLADLKIVTPIGLMIASDFQYNINTGYGAGYNKNYALWNASVTQDFLKNKSAQLRFTILDILKQNQSTRRSINANNITDTKTIILPQYFMFSLIYNLKNFKQAPGEQQDGMRQRGGGMGGDRNGGGPGNRGGGGFGGGNRGGGGGGF